MYQAIDQEKTGVKLKTMLRAAGYDVKFIQAYLHLACPQSIYRWFKGKALPSVENLCAISKLLRVHMEELLVLQGESDDNRSCETISSTISLTRLFSYAKYLKKIA